MSFDWIISRCYTRNYYRSDTHLDLRSSYMSIGWYSFSKELGRLGEYFI